MKNTIKNMPVLAKYILLGIGALMAIKYVLPHVSKLLGFVGNGLGGLKDVPVETNEGKLQSQIEKDPGKYQGPEGSQLTGSIITADCNAIYGYLGLDKPFWNPTGWYEKEGPILSVLAKYNKPGFALLVNQYRVAFSRELVSDLKEYLSDEQLLTINHLWL